MVLITYRCESALGKETWGYSIDNDPIEFIEKVQKYKEETYFIINVLPISSRRAKEWRKKLRGI